VFEKCFGETHPILQKYYAASAEVGSQLENNEMMVEMSKKLCEVVEQNNKTKDGSISIFMLDPLLTKVSIICQVQSSESDID
jgi:hypothetical protein